MKLLTELNFSWVAENGNKYAVHFDCPACLKSHGIVVPFLPWSGYNAEEHHIWQLSGEFPAITLHPSVDATKTKKGKPTGCLFHGWVRNGMVTW